MPTSINGFGTAYYGERDFHADGSYITTEWTILGHIPILPLRSHRLLRNIHQDQNFIIYTSESYIIIETTSWNRPQVIATYGFMLCFVFWIIVLIWLLAIFNVSWFGHSYVFFGIVMAMATPPFVVLFYLRRRDKSGTLFSEEALVRTLAALAERHKPPIISPPPLPVTPQELPQDDDERYKPKY